MSRIRRLLCLLVQRHRGGWSTCARSWWSAEATAGFYAAWGLEKRLRPSEAKITVIDPRPYMTYQPFLPEVAAGSIEARHAAVSLRRHLRRSKVIAGTVTRIDHACAR